MQNDTHPKNDNERPVSGASAGRWLLLVGVAALTILADQASKAYVVAHLALHESWMPLDFIEPIFRFTHVRNTGAAFGIFPQGGSIFLIIAAIVSVFIVYYYRQIPDNAWLVRLALDPVRRRVGQCGRPGSPGICGGFFQPGTLAGV
jgi:signal peptidase II